VFEPITDLPVLEQHLPSGELLPVCYCIREENSCQLGAVHTRRTAAPALWSARQFMTPNRSFGIGARGGRNGELGTRPF
jgi:hypothetical protein